ncbi:MAG TPA: NAD(P)-dependent oxidoreductase [Acidimicrobiales bacterium]|nr:NAD(P)-dependent oxidoreductase [Acidimicrobiales bacterium]
MAQASKLAVLGLGTMGRAMAGSALRAGIPVVAWNRDPVAGDGLADAGIEIAKSVPGAVADADVVITMVTNADAVMSIATGQGLLANMRPGSVWAQMSTIGIDGTDRVAATAKAERADIHFVDAPVAGSKVPAEQGNLVIFASGPGEARPLLAQVFEAIGRRTIWLGPAGEGSRMKLVNNTMLAFTAEAVASSFALAHLLGLETSAVVDAFDGNPLVSPWETAKIPRIDKGDFSAEFALELALKDVLLALSETGQHRFKALGALASEWSDIVDRGFGGEDVTVVAKALAE